MTREELRKIFDEAEKSVCTSENFRKVFEDLTSSEKFPAASMEQMSIRVNRILDKEVVFEVLAKVLADKQLSDN